jgi:hypothetical protein
MTLKNLAYRKKIKVKNGRNLASLSCFNSFGIVWVLLCDFVKLRTALRHQKRPTLEREIANLKLNYAVLDKKIDGVGCCNSGNEDRDNLYRTYFNILPFQRRAQITEANRYRELEGYDN